MPFTNALHVTQPTSAFAERQFVQAAECEAVPDVVHGETAFLARVIVVLSQRCASVGVAAFFAFIVGDILGPSVSGKELQAIGHPLGELHLKSVVIGVSARTHLSRKAEVRIQPPRLDITGSGTA